VQIWAPDTRAHGFGDECARQARLIRNSEISGSDAKGDAWFDASDTAGWTA
jgi:hypothetical protein